MEHIPEILNAVANILDSTVVLMTLPFIIVWLTVSGGLERIVLKALDVFRRGKN